MDVPRVVPCMPGAELVDTVGDDEWKTKISVKLGPVQLVFDADVVREIADVSAHRVVLATRAREIRGRGGAQAHITSSLAPTGEEPRSPSWPTLRSPEPQPSSAVLWWGTSPRQLTERFASCLQSLLASEPASTDVPAAAKPAGGLLLVVRALVRTLFRRGRREGGAGHRSGLEP
jgi:uncharacterized protein